MEHDLLIEYPVESGVLKEISFDILSESDAAKISAKVIEHVNEVTDPALGLPNPVNECRTCGAKNLKACEGHFGLINFPFTILNPYFISEAARVLNKICPGCKSARSDKIKIVGSASRHLQHANCKYCDGTLKDYPPMRFKLIPNDKSGKLTIVAEVNEKFWSKFPHISSGGSLASDYWDIIPHDAGQDESSWQHKKRVLSHGQVYSLLKDADSRLIEAFLKRKNSIFLSCFLLTPNCHRVTELGHHMLFDETNRLYRKLIDFRGTPSDLSMHLLERIKLSKLRAERQAFIDPEFSASGLKFLKELLIAKRSNHVFRLVVVGDPQLNLFEIGIPSHVAESIRIGEHLNSWNLEKLAEHCDLMILQKGWVLVRRNDDLVRISMCDNLQKGDIIYRPLSDGDVVLINRPPSIHHHSLIALSVRILPITSALSINPLICSPFRGDFDGDCLHGYVPQSMDSRVELRELVGLDKQLIDGQSGRNLLSLSHDSLTAAHLVLEDGVFLNRSQIQQLQMCCPRQLPPPAVFEASPKGSCYWTGKQLFSLLLPSDFDYVFPSNTNGAWIRKGEIVSSNGSSWLRDTDGNLFRSLIKHYGDQVIHFLFSAQEVLSEWLSMRGLSVSLSDLYLSPDSSSRKHMLTEISCGLREAEKLSLTTVLMVDKNQDFLIGLFEENKESTNFGVKQLSIEKQKSAVLSQSYVCAFKEVFRDIQSLLYQYANRDNSFLAMLKAGSKGNVLKLVQQSMCLGLQHSLVPLSFKIPHHLSCAAWNDEKNHPRDLQEYSRSCIPSAVVENSFLTGLNPLECYVHSLTNRETSFSGHADVSGTLTRKLMFFMRDLCIGYDGTVRNPFGNQVVQFSYYSTQKSNTLGGGHPVGSLAGSAISEAAYSALDQPISVLESSPLLNLKQVLESGARKSSGEKTASLFLSKMLGRWVYGFEYGALEVKSHLERLLFSDLVSEVMICFCRDTLRGNHSSPWVCHFHINKETAKRRKLKLQSITDALNISYTAIKIKTKVDLPNLQITCVDCFVHDTSKEDSNLCITAAVVGICKDSYLGLEILRDFVIPFLLTTVVKGFSAFKRVDILWREEAPVLPKPSYNSTRPSGELYLRVIMSENCDRTKFWSILVDSCLQIMKMIDWERSRPDDIHEISVAYGIDVAWKCFLSGLSSALSDTGKTILPEHVVLATDSLSSSGQFLALSANGLSLQRKENGFSTPFTQAIFSNPGESFLKAAKLGLYDDLRGSAEALAWGKIPPVGTGFQCDILYSGKGFELSEPTDVYKLLGKHAEFQKQRVATSPEQNHELSRKSLAQRLCTYDGIFSERESSLLLPKAVLSSFSLNDIQRLSRALRNILYTNNVNDILKDSDKSVVMRALYFHPRRNEKIGTGAHDIKVGQHKGHGDSRCFLLVRSDGTEEDFSYHKCVHHALELIAPKQAKTYSSRWLSSAR